MSGPCFSLGAGQWRALADAGPGVLVGGGTTRTRRAAFSAFALPHCGSQHTTSAEEPVCPRNATRRLFLTRYVFSDDNIGMEITLRNLSADAVLVHLTPVLRALHAALDHGVSLADTWLAGLPHDPYLWSHMVRYGACTRLRDPQASGDWQLRSLPMSGIEISRPPLAARVLKALGNAPPPPGTNRARRSFYTQLTLPNCDWDQVGSGLSDVMNIIVDWSVTQERELRLAVSKPVGLWSYPQAANLEWRRRVVIPGDGDLTFSAPEETDIPVTSVLDLGELSAAGDEQ